MQLPPKKLVIGMPVYGFGFSLLSDQNGINAPAKTLSDLDYRSLMNLVGTKSFTYTEDENRVAASISNGSVFYSFESPASAKKKAEWARSFSAGVMLWDLSQDFKTSDKRSLLNQVIDKVSGPKGPLTCLSKSDFCNIRCDFTLKEKIDLSGSERSAWGAVLLLFAILLIN